jgi:capsule polysaccharide modification protein KpsS
MNVLFLLDLVPKYHPMLVGISRELADRGHKVFHALDSPQNLVRFPEHAPPGPIRIFSEFFADHVPGNGAQPEFPWTAFFPDFDRYENYGVNYGNKQEWYLHLASALDAFFSHCIKEWRIDAVVYEGVTNSFAYFASRAALRHGARYLGLQASRLPGRHEWHGTSEAHQRDRVAALYHELENGAQETEEEKDWLDSYLASFQASIPDYMKFNGLNLENPVKKYAKFGHLSTISRLLIYELTRRGLRNLNYRSGSPFQYSARHVKRSVTRWLRSFGLGKFFDDPRKEDHFYLYPLHFHPEASTSVNSRWYVDEYPVIKNLAFSLPPGTWLYVKDHPSAFAYPSREFYRKIAALPNVRLIRPGENMKQLLVRSIGLITQTSTAGYEATILGKPVWVLGEVFYDFHPLCSKIGWTTDLPDALRNPPAEDPDGNTGRRMALAYHRFTYPGALPLDGKCDGCASMSQIAEEIMGFFPSPDQAAI